MRHFAVAAAAAMAACASVAQRPPTLPMPELQNLAAVYGIIRTDYVTEVDGAAVMNACIRGMFDSLDGHSKYLEQADLDAFGGGRSADGQVGVGLELAWRAGLPSVISTFENSPAERAGLKPRDYILEIDGQSMEEVPLVEAVQKLRGPAGTSVALVIRRPGEAVNRTVVLERQRVTNTPILGQRLAQDVGYLKVRSMHDSLGPEVRAEFRKLQAAGPLRGLVLDLRRSPGGMLAAAVELAAMFLPPEAVVVTTEGRQAGSVAPDLARLQDAGTPEDAGLGRALALLLPGP